MQTTEVTTKTNNYMTTGDAPTSTLGTSGILQSDVRLPRLRLAQSGTPEVKAKKWEEGEIRDTIDGAVLGGINKPVRIVPLFTVAGYKISRKVDGQWKFDCMDSRKNNEFREREIQKNGATYLQESTMKVFALLYSELVEGNPVPYEILFKNASVGKAGSSMGVIYSARLAPLEKKIYAISYDLFSIPMKNKNNQEYVCYDIKMSRDEAGKAIQLTPEQLLLADNQANFITKAYYNNNIVSEEDSSGDETVPSNSSPQDQY